MKRFLIYLFKGYKWILIKGIRFISTLYCSIVFFINNIKFNSIVCHGFPLIHVSIKANVTIGYNFKINNGSRYTESSMNGKCKIEVRDSASLIVGNNVGISDVAIICHESIVIGDNVLIGVGSQIRDTDSHSLNPNDWNSENDWTNKETKPIKIGSNVFIGMNCLILKGVTIGNNAIIGAGTVVTKNIPANQIWAGNPAKCLKII